MRPFVFIASVLMVLVGVVAWMTVIPLVAATTERLGHDDAAKKPVRRGSGVGRLRAQAI